MKSNPLKEYSKDQIKTDLEFQLEVYKRKLKNTNREPKKSQLIIQIDNMEKALNYTTKLQLRKRS